MDEGGQRGCLKPGVLGTSPLTASLGHCAPCENSRQKNANNHMILLHVPSASSGFTGWVSPDSALAPSSVPQLCPLLLQKVQVLLPAQPADPRGPRCPPRRPGGLGKAGAW